MSSFRFAADCFAVGLPVENMRGGFLNLDLDPDEYSSDFDCATPSVDSGVGSGKGDNPFARYFVGKDPREMQAKCEQFRNIKTDGRVF